MLTRFGIWYLVTLGPAVILFWIARHTAPLDPTVHNVITAAISVGVLPFAAVIATSFMLAFGIDTDRFLPVWYRRMFGLPIPQ
jgi:hypothetical protein